MTSQTLRPASDTIPAACALLEQMRELVAGLDDEQYTTKSPAMFTASIASHVRHAVDHFRAPLGGLGGDVVDYDHRQRDTDVEKCVRGAVAEIERVRAGIGNIDPLHVGKELTIRVMLTGDGACTDLTTTLAREIAFATHHAVHHNAMIKAIAKELGLETPPGFGKAPSTIDHECKGD